MPLMNQKAKAWMAALDKVAQWIDDTELNEQFTLFALPLDERDHDLMELDYISSPPTK
jgi:hypothetical protein